MKLKMVLYLLIDDIWTIHDKNFELIGSEWQQLFSVVFRIKVSSTFAPQRFATLNPWIFTPKFNPTNFQNVKV